MASVPAQRAVWGIGLQADRLGDTAPVVSAIDWYRFRVPTISGGNMQDQSTLPLEIGGPLTPTGGFKSGAYFAQEVDIIPRLEDTLGWLLLATLGNVSSITGQKYSAAGWSTNTGATGHLFRFNPDDHSDLPYLAARTLIPGVNNAANRGLLGYDCKASGLRLNVPGAGLITGRFGVQGRVPMMPDTAAVNAWTWENGYEGSKSIAHAGKGELTIGSTLPKVTGLTIDFTNTLTAPRDEFIVGSYFPDDVQVLTRAVSMRASMKWENSDLWSLLYNGATTGADWSNLPYFSETVGAVRGFFFEAQSPQNIDGASVPYAIRVMADNVMLSCDPASLRLRAGGIIEFMVNIDVLQPDNTLLDYVQVAIDNDTASYVAP